MNEAEYIERIALALRKVPATKLLIIDLANRFVVEGQLDYYAMEESQQDINLAVAEAKTYGGHTLIAVNALANLEAKAVDVGFGHPESPESTSLAE